MKHSQITKQKVILSTKHSFPLKWHAIISIHAASSEWCVTYCSSYWAERKMGARKGPLQFWIDPIVCRGIQKGNLFRHENWFRSFSLQFEPEHLELPWADLEAEVLMSSGHGCISKCLFRIKNDSFQIKLCVFPESAAGRSKGLIQNLGALNKDTK